MFTSNSPNSAVIQCINRNKVLPINYKYISGWISENIVVTRKCSSILLSPPFLYARSFILKLSLEANNPAECENLHRLCDLCPDDRVIRFLETLAEELSAWKTSIYPIKVLKCCQEMLYFLSFHSLSLFFTDSSYFKFNNLPTQLQHADFAVSK